MSESFEVLRSTWGLPPEPRTDDSIERTRRRIEYLLATDPGGSWVAEDDHGVVAGVSQALLREELWVLSLLAVSPRAQDLGVGKELLEAALAYGSTAPKGMILCSRDPRAIRRYCLAGFDLQPSVTARGEVQRRRLQPTRQVAEGTAADLGFVADLDRRLRGGPHGPDLEELLDQGCRLWVWRGGGYVVARGARPLFLAARTEEVAEALLTACLAQAVREEIVEVSWITAPQRWAVRAALEAGLHLHPAGPVMTRGMEGPPQPYLPSGTFG